MANDKKFIVKNGLSAQNIDFVDNNFVKVITLNTDANTAVFSDSVDDILRVGGVSADGTVLEFNDTTGTPIIRIQNEDVSITPASGRLLIGSIDNPNSVDRVQVSGSLSSTILKTDQIKFANTLVVSSGDTELASFTDESSDIVFVVNDREGVPSIEVDDTGTIRFAETFGNVLIGTATDNGNKLQVNGTISANNITITGAISANGSIGTAGQTLRSDGTKTYWSTEVGYTGSKGDIGYTGSIGFTGSQGDIGFTGSRGNTGFTGSVGFTGSIGFTGSGGAFTADGSNNLYAIATLPALTTGSDNFAAGNLAGNSITSGFYNVAIGPSASYGATTSYGSTFIGFNAGYNADANYSIGLGREALRGDSAAKLTGANNIGIGFQTGYDLTTGINNFLGGYQAGANLTTGSYNVAIGAGAGANLTTGSRNVAVGFEANGRVTDGADNAAFGQGANTLNNSSQTTALGNYALRGSSINSVSTRNTAVGYRAGFDVSTGGNNTFVGAWAGDNISTGSNNIVIGDGSDASSATVSNEITLGNSSITKLRVPGISVEMTNKSVTLGTWTITEDVSGNLMFAVSGVNKMKLDSSGNLSITGDINVSATL